MVQCENSGGMRWTRVGLASWQGNGLPRRRSIAGLRGWTATLGLRHGPDSYGRQQWGILHNGETLMQRRRVSEEVFRYVKLYQQGRK